MSGIASGLQPEDAYDMVGGLKPPAGAADRWAKDFRPPVSAMEGIRSVFVDVIVIDRGPPIGVAGCSLYPSRKAGMVFI